VSVAPGGTFERLGVRPGDIPIEFHCCGSTALEHALSMAAKGESSNFEVVNVADWTKPGRGVRRIDISRESK